MPSDVLLDQAHRIACDIVGEARSTLMALTPFLDVALWKMPLAPSHGETALGTDGRTLAVGALAAITDYRRDPNEIVRDYLHVVLHCVFRHPFDDRHPNKAAWDVACDVAVEAAALELVGAGVPSARDAARADALERIRRVCPQLTAGKLYRAMAHAFEADDAGAPDAAGFEGQATRAGAAPAVLPRALVATLPRLFRRDDHALWPRTDEERARRLRMDDRKEALASDGSERLRGEEGAPDEDEQRDEERSPGANLPGAAAPASSTSAAEGEVENPDAFADMDALSEAKPLFGSVDDVELSDFASLSWQEVGALVELDMEGFSGKIGSEAGTLMANLAVANRKRYDYREFLKRFSSRTEEMKVSTEEFDYLFYTYGLKLYGNMPLVEPLEYQESDRIRDFVIAIDTSGSCAGTLVRTFVEKTYDILKNAEGFGRKVNIRIIQCDCEVRSETSLDSVRELATVFDALSVRGFGGTDFRPVFKRVDELVASRELVNLKGLIYFTDGLGVYPTHPPDYETVFVFVTDAARDRTVPPWAMKVVMDEDDILELR